jgi:hypothetical protein
VRTPNDSGRPPPGGGIETMASARGSPCNEVNAQRGHSPPQAQRDCLLVMVSLPAGTALAAFAGSAARLAVPAFSGFGMRVFILHYSLEHSLVTSRQCGAGRRHLIRRHAAARDRLGPHGRAYWIQPHLHFRSHRLQIES